MSSYSFHYYIGIWYRTPFKIETPIAINNNYRYTYHFVGTLYDNNMLLKTLKV